MKKYYDKDQKLNIELSQESDDDLFTKIADLIIKKFDGTTMQKLDSMDQRYWDFKLDMVEFCLHQEHFLGISIYAKNTQSNDIVTGIAHYLNKEVLNKTWDE